MILPTHIVAVGGLVLNEKDEVLLINNPCKGWEYPGGIVEVGETLPQGLIREVKEETGVNIEIVDFIGIYSNTEKKQGFNGVKEVPTIVTIDFVCKYVSGELKTSEESCEVGWFSKSKALEIIKSKQKLRLERALNYKEGISCIGWCQNSDKDLEIHEQYFFKR